MADFVHLHLHSEYSLLDGACRIKDIPKKAKKEGQTAVAITDHGVMYGAVDFYNACKAEGVKPIVGCEVYVAPRSRFDKEGRADASGNHLVLLCENETGYKNLIALVSAGFTEGFHAKPRIDMELLEKKHEGLIALSACVAGKIPQLILAGDMEGAQKYAVTMRDLFGPDRFYLEIQDHGLEEEKKVREGILELSSATGIGMVATNDVHYIEKADAEMQEVLVCIQTGNTLADGSPLAFDTDEFYFKTADEMDALFAAYPHAVENTVKIADMCHFDFHFGETHLPTFAPPAGKTHKECLEDLANRGFAARVKRGFIDFSYADEKAYRDRLQYELSVIDRMGFNAYYLIMQDFIAYAKQNGIPVGPGRGSGAGSLVAYSIGITDIDPLRYDLLFERFLNPERISLPDFDTDFCYERREEVIDYVKKKYGEDHVAQIVTFGTMAARAAVRDVGRALGMPYAEVDRVARLIGHGPDTTIQSVLEKKELSELYHTSPEIKHLLDMSLALEGMPRHASTHAAGIVITEKPLCEYVPLSTNGDTLVTQFDMDTDAALGLVKFDFLGLRYLTILADAEKAVKAKEPSFSLDKIPLDDKRAYRLLCDGKTSGLFQLESGGMRQLLLQMKPATIEDITAAIALYRPGPMDSIDRFIACRNGTEKPKYPHPSLEKILAVTNGCIVYQEQVMQICREVAGYSFAKADLVRRAISKKKPEVMQAERASFVQGAAENGVSCAVAEQIFDDIVGFASYAFNKSHAAAYAVVSYRTAYMKANYRAEYMAAMMTSVFGDSVKIAEYIAECQKANISVLPPDINESELYFSAKDGYIRFGLLAIKNVGRTFVEGLLSERKKAPFDSFIDFATRMAGGDLNRRQMEALIKCGAFDRLGVFRSRLLASYEQILEQVQSRTRTNLTGQLDLFSMNTEESAPSSDFTYPDLPDFTLREKLLLEKESAGMCFSGHILDDYKRHVAELGVTSIADILQSYDEETGESDKYENKQSLRLAGVLSKRVNKKTRSGEDMAFITLEDRFSEMDMLLFPKVLARYASMLSEGTPVCAEGELSLREGDAPKLLLSKLILLNSDAAYENAIPCAKVYVKLPSLKAKEIAYLTALCKKAANGPTGVYLFGEEEKKYVQLNDAAILLDHKLKEELFSTFGEENVVMK